MAKFKEIIVKSIDVESGNYLSITDETKNITALDIYLVPKEGGEHERYVVDNNGLISKQSAGKKLLPLYESEGINDNVSPFVSLSIDKDNGVSFYQHDSFINWFNQDSIFNFGRSGIDFIYRQSADNEGDSRNGRFNINTGGNVFIGTTKSSDRYSNHAYITLNPDTNSIKNTFYEGSLGQEKFIEFSIDGIKTNTLSNADGDLSFTNHVVIKDDGTFGYEPKRSSTPTLYPKVDILEYSQDSTNYYVRVSVSNMETLGFAGNPYFDVVVGASGETIDAVGMVGTYSNDIGSQKYSYTQDPFTLGGFEFILNIPKAQNIHPWWNDNDKMLSVTYKGMDNLDIQGGGTSPYKPRRVANDTKKISQLKALTVVNTPKYSYYSGSKFTNTNSSTTGILNLFVGGAINGKDMNEVTGQENVVLSYSDTISLTTGNCNVMTGYFHTITTGGSNSLYGRRAGRGITTGSRNTIIGSNGEAGIEQFYPQDLSDYTEIGAGIPIKTPVNGALNIHNKIFGEPNGNIGIGVTDPTQSIDVSNGARFRGLPNATGDATYTRQLVQKADGVIAWQPKTLEPTVFKYTTGSNVGISTFYRVDYPLYFTSNIGREAIELVPHDRFNAPNNNKFGASGERSTAIGYGARAVGMSSVAIGGGTANGQESIAIGRGTAGFQSVSIQSIDSVDNGGTNTMIGTFGSNIGEVSGNIVIGGRAQTITNAYTQNSAIIGGQGHTINGALASTIIGGGNNVATSELETIMGCMATIGVGQGGSWWVPTDRLFTIGCGGENNSATRADAFQILKNGYTTVPSQTLALFKNGGAKGIATKEAVELVNAVTRFSTSAELNTAYPNAIKGFEVYVDNTEVLYKKVTDTKWATIQVGLMS